MARGPGPLTRPRPDTVAMPKRGKRLKFRAQDACSGRGGRGAGALKDLGLEAGLEGTVASARLSAMGGRLGPSGDLECAENLGGEEAEEGRLLL